ncbi:MAG: hypothetical protein J3Q66DRAFT_110753 [Benniella sp.]|nr:MAG: hypothetical protein J3Q66DRAFT_110753 [Benniella sp.]
MQYSIVLYTSRPYSFVSISANSPTRCFTLVSLHHLPPSFSHNLFLFLNLSILVLPQWSRKNTVQKKKKKLVATRRWPQRSNTRPSFLLLGKEHNATLWVMRWKILAPTDMMQHTCATLAITYNQGYIHLTLLLCSPVLLFSCSPLSFSLSPSLVSSVSTLVVTNLIPLLSASDHHRLVVRHSLCSHTHTHTHTLPLHTPSC